MGRPPRAPDLSANVDPCSGLMLRSIAARVSHAAIHGLGPRCDASRSMGRPPDAQYRREASCAPVQWVRALGRATDLRPPSFAAHGPEPLGEDLGNRGKIRNAP